jgi:hypothetical protein
VSARRILADRPYAYRLADKFTQAEPDQMPRLEAFKRQHPRVAILLRGDMPAAWTGSDVIRRPTLRELLDMLDEMFPPHTRDG